MKKGLLSKFTVKRLSSSPYFPPNFIEKEKEIIANLSGALMLPVNTPALASILITNTHTDVTSISSEQLNSCKLLIHPNSGYDNLSYDFVSNVNFPIIVGSPIRANAVANYILSALFSHYSPLPTEITWSQSRSWPRKILSELNILIIGFGHIGNILHKSLTPLAKEVRLYDPYAGFPILDLTDIDVVIPVCGLNKNNHYLIDIAMMLKLNDDFLLINAARGPLVNTKDLLSVLSIRPKAFVFLDVFENEPCDLIQFKNIKNIKCTSHIAGVYQNIDMMTAHFEAQVISDFINFNSIDFENKYNKMILKNRLQCLDFLI